MKTIIIAEAGVNHNGSFKKAKKMIKVAKICGADYIKFQTAFVEEVMTKKAPKAKYQIKNTKNKNESQIEMAQRIHLKTNHYQKLLNECKKINIKFLSSPFDLKSINLLSNLKLKTFKIPSGEITNLPYLIEIAKKASNIILSTGMCSLSDISQALKILRKYGNKRKKIVILHCNTDYPTSFKDVNLKAMNQIKKKFNVDVGYSDHSLGIEVSIAAVALGAKIIEKHFTLSRKLKGPDHSSSLEPKELKKMCLAIRNIEKSLGDGIKKPSSSEIKNKLIVRKSIVASQEIKKGEFFTNKNITTKRPGNGLSPMLWFKIIGRKSKKHYKIDEFI